MDTTEKVMSAAYPPQEVFLSSQGMNQAHEVVKSGLQTFILEKVECPKEGGMYQYLQGLLYPRKGFPFPEFIWTLNSVKKMSLIFTFGIVNKNMLLPAIGFALTPWKRKVAIVEKFLERFNAAANNMLAPYYFQDQFYMSCAKELRAWVARFLINLGIRTEVAENTALIISMFIEGDNAYRQRLQDALTYPARTCGRLTKEDFTESPADAIRTIVKTVSEREPQGMVEEGVVDKYARIGKALRYIFYVPRIRKAFVQATQDVNFDNLYMDEADEYHCLWYGDYSYFGQSLEERWAKLAKMHGGTVPNAVVIQ